MYYSVATYQEFNASLGFELFSVFTAPVTSETCYRQFSVHLIDCFF